MPLSAFPFNQVLVSDVMLVGESESSITPFAIAGFRLFDSPINYEDPALLLFHLTRSRQKFCHGRRPGMLVLERSLEH